MVACQLNYCGEGSVDLVGEICWMRKLVGLTLSRAHAAHTYSDSSRNSVIFDKWQQDIYIVSNTSEKFILKLSAINVIPTSRKLEII
jgi:hypothetical protein